MVCLRPWIYKVYQTNLLDNPTPKVTYVCSAAVRQAMRCISTPLFLNLYISMLACSGVTKSSTYIPDIFWQLFRSVYCTCHILFTRGYIYNGFGITYILQKYTFNKGSCAEYDLCQGINKVFELCGVIYYRSSYYLAILWSYEFR